MGRTGQPGNTSTDAAASYGGAGRRLLARIIDGLVVGSPLSILLSLLGGGCRWGLAQHRVCGRRVRYFVSLETTSGATFGKRLLRLRVADATGSSPMTPPSSARRNWWMMLDARGGAGVLVLVVGLVGLAIVATTGVAISRDTRSRGWHDKTAETTVLRSA